MNVLVLGASGASGRRIVEHALAAGHRVTAFARDPAGAGLEGHDRLRAAAGDVLEQATLAAALPGQDAVIWAVGGHDALRSALQRRRRQRGLCESGTRNLLAAMEPAGVTRLLCQSSWGVGDSQARLPAPQRLVLFPLLLRAELADKERQEQLIRDSMVEWTIIRPTRLTDAPGTRRYSAAPGLSFRFDAHVPRADVADLMMRELAEPRFLRQTVEISA